MRGNARHPLPSQASPFWRPEWGEALRPADPEDREAKPAKVVHRKAARVGLLAHCGTGNLGDEASVAAVLQHIKSRWPGTSLSGLSMDPEDTALRHGIPCFAMRQTVFPFEREWSSASKPARSLSCTGKLKELLRKTGPLFGAAKEIRKFGLVSVVQFMREVLFLGRSLILTCKLDLLVICGGGQLLDWGGPWAFPYTLFKWVLLAKCGRAKCVFLNSGAGPLDKSLSRWFARRALSMADYISLRDHASGETLRKIGFRGNMSVVADVVWGLRLPEGLVPKWTEPKGALVIGIAPMAYGDPSRYWVNDNPAYRRLIESLADFSGRMLVRGHQIRLFSSDIWFDSQAIADLEAAIRREHPVISEGRLAREPVSDIAGMLRALSRVDCYVTCRFHGVILASLLNVPTLALAPHPKVTTLMNDMGLSDYCMDIARCDADEMTSRFDRLVDSRGEVKARIRRHVEQCRNLLAAQFDELFQDDAKNIFPKNRSLDAE